MSPTYENNYIIAIWYDLEVAATFILVHRSNLNLKFDQIIDFLSIIIPCKRSFSNCYRSTILSKKKSENSLASELSNPLSAFAFIIVFYNIGRGQAVQAR